jgi:hypothetical protein
MQVLLPSERIDVAARSAATSILSLGREYMNRSFDTAIANLYHYFQIEMFYSDCDSLVQINEFNLDLPS